MHAPGPLETMQPCPHNNNRPIWKPNHANRLLILDQRYRADTAGSAVTKPLADWMAEGDLTIPAIALLIMVGVISKSFGLPIRLSMLEGRARQRRYLVSCDLS